MTFILSQEDYEDYLLHYGILRKSGRYPWGSGDNQSQRNKSFLDHVQKLKEQGLSEVEIATGFGITTSELRNYKTIARNEQRQSDMNTAARLKAEGNSNMAIAREMGKPESSVRALLKQSETDRQNVLESTVDMLKDAVDRHKYVDVGKGVEAHMAISKDKLKAALAVMTDEGYKIHYGKIPQVGNPGKFTSLKVLTKDDVPWSEMRANFANVRMPQQFSTDGGRSYIDPVGPPISISSKRLAIRYGDQGGGDADGVIYVRPGVKDVSLGKNRYAQVRVAIDNSHFLKGMAIYKDDLPDGVDLMFNTPKKDTGNKLDALKPMKEDLDLPFGAVVRPLTERGADGKERIISSMNIVNDEGRWEDWSKTLSTQFLSKQSPRLIKAQLDKTYDEKRAAFDEIKSLTNPTVRKKLLEGYSDGVDASAVHLKAAQMPRQATRVILPLSTIKETEVYAPTFRDGERVVLIRYPHGGIFEIPELTVNKRNREGKQLLGDATDAIGIHPNVAKKLSGADFDGDTVLVIPNNAGQVKTAPSLLKLKDFDPVAAYPGYPGMKVMTERMKGQQMGQVSNLITDMSIHGANQDEIARAVRHSMVVIDAEKKELNYKQSAIDNNIKQLKQKYQGGSTAGASTLISRANAKIRVPAKKPRSAREGGPIDIKTGKKVFVPAGEKWIDKEGKVHYPQEKSRRLAEEEDAFKLVSSKATPVEKLYATHSNKLKALANEARKEMVTTKDAPYNKSAKAAYAKEVASLDAKLNIALRNAPLERQAQLAANSTVSAKRQANPDLEEKELKKIKSQALNTARDRFQASKHDIQVTDREWEAIQAGAISKSKLESILNNSDLETIKKLAMPKTQVLMTSSKKQRAQRLLASGYTQADVADALGVSLSTLKANLAEG